LPEIFENQLNLRSQTMKKILLAVAFAVALPAVAHAQAAPAPAPKKHCCCEDKSKPMDCCDEHGKGGTDAHAGHDMGQPQQHQQ
jgi:hypothetical protein